MSMVSGVLLGMSIIYVCIWDIKAIRRSRALFQLASSYKKTRATEKRSIVHHRLYLMALSAMSSTCSPCTYQE